MIPSFSTILSVMCLISKIMVRKTSNHWYIIPICFLAYFNRFKFRDFLLLDRLPYQVKLPCLLYFFLSIAGGKIVFPKGISAIRTANSLIRSGQRVHLLLRYTLHHERHVSGTLTLYIYISIYIYMCVCVCVFVCVCVYIYIYMRSACHSRTWGKDWKILTNCVCVCVCVCVRNRIRESVFYEVVSRMQSYTRR